LPNRSASQLRAQRRIFAGFPFDRPRSATPTGGTLVEAVATGASGGLSNCRPSDYWGAMTAKHARLLALVAAIVVAAVLRLVPHPPNFTPIGAMALFSGAYLGRRWTAFAATFGALLLSDAILGFHSGMPYVYASVALVVVLGWSIQARIEPLWVGLAAATSSVLFFIVTNFGVWLSSGMYPLTPSGLAACYVAAIPFFQNTLAGDLFYSAMLFGGFALLERAVPRIRSGARRQTA
jgi:hypothetical protein